MLLLGALKTVLNFLDQEYVKFMGNKTRKNEPPYLFNKRGEISTL